MIASGEGANRISFQYYSKFRNPVIEDRVLLLNTTTADVKPEKTFEYLISKDASLQQAFEEIKRERICIFGKSPSGAGNNWKVGENEARDDFDTIRRYISNLKLTGRDVVLGVTTLGGGTGNGSLPLIINKLKYGNGFRARRENSYLALGIIPYGFEAPQRHFNTICGITRLLKFGKEGRQNADIVILVDNSQIEKILNARDKLAEERYYKINQEIIKAINMMIAPGGKEAKSTIDVADYYQLPSNIGIYHFTPCMSLGNDPEIFELEAALETAASSPMAPLDTKTAMMAYVIVVAPKKYVDSGKFSQEELESRSYEWALKNMAGKWGGMLRYSSLISSPQQETLDVMILLGGFSLDRIISTSIEKYRDFISILKTDDGKVELIDQDNPEIRAKINVKDIQDIENRLKEYITLTEKKISMVRREESDAAEELSEFGFEKKE